MNRSSISESWKLCSIGGFCSLILLTLFLTSSNPPTFQFSFQLQNHASTSTLFNPLANQTTYEILNTTSNVLFKESTVGGKEYEIPTQEANFEIQAVNTTTSSDIKDLFQSEKLFSASELSGTKSSLEYEVPTWYDETSNNRSEEVKKKCRIYEGKWVYKPEENPRYVVYDCPFLEDKMSCRKNGRPDSDYEGWGWEPHNCHLPLFNATDMLERLRGKRMVIIGDSLNRNQWESLACLLYSSIPNHTAYVAAEDPAYKVFKAKDYEFTLEFYWAPFLIHLNEKHESGRKVLSLDKVVPTSDQWLGAHIMLFNSGHWWTHTGKLRAWDVFEHNGEFIEEMENEEAYEHALSTWARWVSANIDPSKTKVYFRSISPEHKKQWCYNHSFPMGEKEAYTQAYPVSMMKVVERKIREVNARGGEVTYLNITELSKSRIDAHPSINRWRHWKVITDKYKRFLKSRSDCSHWCLPGLPDTWNRILYASLFFDHLDV